MDATAAEIVDGDTLAEDSCAVREAGCSIVTVHAIHWEHCSMTAMGGLDISDLVVCQLSPYSPPFLSWGYTYLALLSVSLAGHADADDKPDLDIAELDLGVLDESMFR